MCDELMSYVLTQVLICLRILYQNWGALGVVYLRVAWAEETGFCIPAGYGLRITIVPAGAILPSESLAPEPQIRMILGKCIV